MSCGMKQRNHASEKKPIKTNNLNNLAEPTLANPFLRSQQALLGRSLSVSVGLGLIDGFLIVLQAWWLANIIQQLTFYRGELADQFTSFLLLLPLFTLRAVLRWVAKQNIYVHTQKLKCSLRERGLTHISALGPVQSKQLGTGHLLHCLTNAVDAIEAYYVRYLPAKFLVVLLPLAILIAIIPIDKVSVIVMCVTAPLIPFCMILIGKNTQEKNQRQWRQLSRMSCYFLDRLQGLLTLKIFQASQREITALHAISEQYRTDTMAVLRVAFLSSLALEFLATVSIAMIAVLIGFRLMWGEMQFAHGLFILLLAPEFYLPLRQMGGHYHARMDAVAAAEQLAQLLHQQVSAEPSKTSDDSLMISQYHNAPTIHLKNIDVSYMDGDNGVRHALHQLSMTLQAGETVVMIGPSGSGKSTIVNLLLGFLHPNCGEIRIDEHVVENLNQSQWQNQIAWVPQSPYLFHGTIADNIALGQPKASASEIRRAAELANIDDDIQSMPQAYQTLIGERGEGLSGGQIRRVALARAFLRNAVLVILDEPTASLDTEAEAKILPAIQRLVENKTALIISHRRTLLSVADRVIRLERGQVVEESSALNKAYDQEVK